MKNSLKITALASTILLTAAFAGPAQAAKPDSETKSLPIVAPEVPISAPTATLTFDKPQITTTAAPVVAPVAVAPAVVQITPVKPTTPTTNTPSTPAPVAAPAPKAPAAVAPPVASPVAASGSSVGASLLASAYGQIGIKQDCTRMVENALASVGIISGDLAPAQFFRFGTVVGTPAPGDILISAGHVGIYAGNGQMISGGFNGSQTVLHPVSYVGAYTAVRV